MHESLFQVATMILMSTKLTLGIQISHVFSYDTSRRFHTLKQQKLDKLWYKIDQTHKL